jgi:hypothetical protein
MLRLRLQDLLSSFIFLQPAALAKSLASALIT